MLARVNELCAKIKADGIPVYFGSVGVNHGGFPGIKEIHKVLVETNCDYAALSVLMQRTWHRAT